MLNTKLQEKLQKVNFPVEVQNIKGIPSDMARAVVSTDQASNDGNTVSATNISTSASFSLDFKGTNPVSTITMHAHAPLGFLNNSSNPTYKLFDSSSIAVSTSSYFYTEPTEIPIKNTMSSSFCEYSASFRKQTFISKVGIYDKDQNLIAIANLAKPVKKLEDRDYTFKIKLDV